MSPARQAAPSSPSPGSVSTVGTLFARRRVVSKVVSGGQTGVDRAALDFAIEHGIEYGGWCPKGGWAEDLCSPPGLLECYPGLSETETTNPALRTVANVRDSDATLIIVGSNCLDPSPGVRLTLDTALVLGRPYAVLCAGGTAPLAQVACMLSALAYRNDDEGGFTLNVTGGRHSDAPGIYEEARRLLEEIAGLLLAR